MTHVVTKNQSDIHVEPGIGVDECSGFSSVIPDSSFDIARQEVSTLQPPDQQAFWLWVSGEIADPPEQVKSVIANLSNKLNMTAGYLTALNLARMERMSVRLREMEEALFSPEVFERMSIEDKISLYDVAQKTYQSNLEAARRFISQNRATLKALEEKPDELKQKLLSLSPDQLSKLKNFVDSRG